MPRIGWAGCVAAGLLLLATVLPRPGHAGLLDLRRGSTTTGRLEPANSPAYTHEHTPKRQPYYMVPYNVETYPYFGGVPVYRWGYFGATRHCEVAAPHVQYNYDYREKIHRYGD